VKRAALVVDHLHPIVASIVISLVSFFLFLSFAFFLCCLLSMLLLLLLLLLLMVGWLGGWVVGWLFGGRQDVVVVVVVSNKLAWIGNALLKFNKTF
jgi:hypothetical protein